MATVGFELEPLAREAASKDAMPEVTYIPPSLVCARRLPVRRPAAARRSLPPDYAAATARPATGGPESPCSVASPNGMSWAGLSGFSAGRRSTTVEPGDAAASEDPSSRAELILSATRGRTGPRPCTRAEAQPRHHSFLSERMRAGSGGRPSRTGAGGSLLAGARSSEATFIGSIRHKFR